MPRNLRTYVICMTTWLGLVALAHVNGVEVSVITIGLHSFAIALFSIGQADPRG